MQCSPMYGWQQKINKKIYMPHISWQIIWWFCDKIDYKCCLLLEIVLYQILFIVLHINLIYKNNCLFIIIKINFYLNFCLAQWLQKDEIIKKKIYKNNLHVGRIIKWPLRETKLIFKNYSLYFLYSFLLL